MKMSKPNKTQRAAARAQGEPVRKLRALSAVFLVGLSVAVTSGCAWFRSTVNDSPGLRWWLFSNFGAQQVCPKVLSLCVWIRVDPSLVDSSRTSASSALMTLAKP
jgi:hypothetical protein